MSTRYIGFLFQVTTPTEFSGRPTQKNITNSYDLIADLLSLTRLEGERNVSFKERIMDTRVHPGGPEYFGVVNNLTRDLGYEREFVLTIDLKTQSTGETIARNPKVVILPNKVILYHDWRPDGTEEVDKEIRTYQPTDEGYFLSGLVSQINTSSYFVATMESTARPNYHSSNLLRDTSEITIYNYPLSSDKRTVLYGEHLIEGTISFYESDVFKTEVSIEPTSPGEYWVDRENGIVYTYSIPSGNYGVDYHYANFPMLIDYSPIKIYTLNDDDFQYEIYQHKTLDSGEIINALPNTEGSEILHQLYKETEVFWGK
jgi:hypothetical protein